MRLPVLLALFAAGPATAADPVPGEDLFPLSVGRSWTYRVSSGGPVPPQAEKFVVRVVGRELVGEVSCYRLEASLGDRVVASECVGVTPEGVCRFKVEKEEVAPPVPFLKPQKRGETSKWEVADYRIGTRSASASFTPGWTGLPFKGENLRVYRVSAESTESGEKGARKTTVYYAPGIGIVKQLVEDRRGFFTLDLEGYEKGEAPK